MQAFAAIAKNVRYMIKYAFTDGIAAATYISNILAELVETAPATRIWDLDTDAIATFMLHCTATASATS